MESLLHLSPVVYFVVGGVVLFLLLSIFATEYLANVVSQLFEIVGRLVNDVARETESASNTLTRMLGGVLHLHRRQATPPARPSMPSRPVSGEPAPSQSQVNQQPPTEETPLTWVAETIFTRLLYLVTVIVVVGSDFVFAILRLQAVLFPSLPTPVKDLSLLSLLTGALLVSIVLLTGALTLDFLDILPEQVQLFPKLSRGKRLFLLGISIVSFLLSLVAVGLLFFQGQVLTSLANTFPLGAVFLATLIGVLQVLVVFLGAWGAIRGLAILLALLGGLIGLVLHIIAVALRWVGDAIDLTGTVVLRNLILAIAALFGRREVRPANTHSTDNVLTIIGFGDRSSSFTALLCEEVARMYGRSGLLAGGTYSSEPAVQDAAHARLVRAGVNDISPLSAHDAEPLVTLKNNLLGTYGRKKATNKMLLWVVDGEQTLRTTGTLSALKGEAPDLSITVLCLLPPDGIRRERNDPFPVLEKLATPKASGSDATITTTIVVDDRSPLYRHHGEPIADRLVARSLSGMLLAPQHNPGNPSFLSVMRGMFEEGYRIAALSVDSDGVMTTRRDATPGDSSRGSGSVSPEMALDRTKETADRLLTGATATTVEAGPTDLVAGRYISFIVPINARSQDFATYRGLISKWLADDKQLYLYGVIDGEGVDLTTSTTTAPADRYAQVGVLYALTDSSGLNRASTNASSSDAANGSARSAGNDNVNAGSGSSGRSR